MRSALSVMLAAIALLGVSGAWAIDFTSTAGQAHQKLGLNCAACHDNAAPTARAPANACFKCHGADNTYAGVGPKRYVSDGGASKMVNPHRSHLVELPCGECHRIHQASVNYCNTCHLFSTMPVK